MTRPSAPPPGVYVPLVTFFNEDESLDEESLRTHAVRLAEGGLTGLVLFGTNGEAVHCDADDRRRVISITRQALDAAGYQHVIIIAGTGAESRRETLKFTTISKEAGAAYALVISPHYWPFVMTKPVLTDFYTSLADQSDLPILIYNFPLVAGGIDLDSDILLELAEHPNIVGCKLTCGNMGKLTRIAAHKKTEEFNVMGGKSDHFVHTLVGGGGGLITGLGNLFPKVHVELWRRWYAGDIKGAQELQFLLADADSANVKLGTSGLKAAVGHYFGYGSPIVRSPLPSNGASKIQGGVPGIFDELLAIERKL